METHILTNPNPKLLNESLKGWLTPKLRWKLQGGLCYSDAHGYSILLVRVCKTPVKRFAKPTIKEVMEFAKENKLTVDAATFINYYESNGWKVNKNPMRKWESAVRNWHNRNKEKVVETKVESHKVFDTSVIDKAQANKSDPAKVKRMLEEYKVTGQLSMRNEE